MATVNDASSIFWNPSGLVNIDRFSFLGSHINWLAGIKHESGAIALNLSNAGIVGFSFSYLTSGEMEITTYDHQEGTGEFFTYSDIMLGISWARRLTDRFAFGGTIKYVYEDFGVRDDFEDIPITSGAVAFDIGTQYETGFRTLRIGLAILNFGPELKPAGQFEDIIGFDSKEQEYIKDNNKDFKAYPMPMTFKAGIAADILNGSNQTMTVTTDIMHPSDNVEQVNFGVEYVLLDVLSLRGGYINGADAARFSAGIGFHFGPINVDYAFLDYGIINNVQTFSATINL